MVLIGIDIGTTNIKTVVIDATDAHVLAAADREHPIHHPRPGYSEQNPAEWWEAVVETTRRALADSATSPSSVSGIGLSGQMHGTVFVGDDNQPVRPAIIWADTRSSPQVKALKDRLSIADMARHAPGQPAAGFMGPTLMWMAAHEPDTLARTKVVLLPKDAVRLKLTDQISTEPSDAAATWLFDVVRGDWSDALLNACNVDRRIMPPVMESAAVAGALTRRAAETLGLPAGIPVVTGSADLPAQALGYGLFEPGRALVTVGTGGQVVHPLTAPAIDPDLRYYVFNHSAAGRWYAQAATLSAGLSLRWLRDTINAGGYERLSELAAKVPPGADGLIFLPYLAGERTPIMDPAASGVFLGLRLHHEAGHMARAIMEGVMFSLADCLDLAAQSSKTPVTEVIASGGATKSPVWRQIMADVLGRPLMLSQGAHHACVGAALLAGVGAGLYENIAGACSRLPAPQVAVIPDRTQTAFYRERRERYRGLYDRLKDDMHALRS